MELLDVGTVLRTLREFYKYDKKTLAAKLRITYSTLNNSEKNYQPSPLIIDKYAKFFKIPISHIYFVAENSETKISEINFDRLLNGFSIALIMNIQQEKQNKIDKQQKIIDDAQHAIEQHNIVNYIETENDS
jgi:DNA-binding XRE family transcriptional regulator